MKTVEKENTTNILLLQILGVDVRIVLKDVLAVKMESNV